MLFRTLGPVAALLLGSAFLLFAGGMNGLLLPIRGEIEGFTAASLGMLGTGWAIGYVAGCLGTPVLVARVGHVRAFGVMCALAAITVLASLLFLTPWVWTPMRAISGFCFAGAAMIVESWLSERAGRESRGRIFGIYTMVNLGATTLGQLALTLGDPSGHVFFVVAAMIYCLALVPTAVSASQLPAPLTSVALDLPALWRNSPIAVFSVLMVGISNGAFGALSAVYAARQGLTLADVALFASVPLLAGALAQAPVGILSDRLDRRLVLIGTALLCACADLLFVIGLVDGTLAILLAAGVFGATAFSMYPLIAAHANDHASEGTALQVSGGLLLVFGIGSIFGPSAAGFAMTAYGAQSLFVVTGAAHVLLVLFALFRLRARAAVAHDDKTAFRPIPLPRAATPQTAAFAAGEADAPQGQGG
ncbi:MFS transporter [Roseivivax isoporae]|uniref:MFS transporter n=1 Tax=Roseivivax isoporae LMG 25204 TaxID=1449351 RepID=X7F6Z2_9RHOB|nr:MFS transporter [Roseivivax isoporae]ETX27854.1 MFS transporter [Roseivivax isoporae LMG 25204]